MLRANRTLVKLDLSWNEIKGDSAVELARCLNDNGTLEELLLAHNGFADRGAQELGEALTRNRALRVLDLAYNNASPAAACVIANALRTNGALERLRVDGNTLGAFGAQALVGALQQAQGPGRNLDVSMKYCDVSARAAGSEGLFNPLEPAGDHELDLATPYDRMVALELLRLATMKDGFSFAGAVTLAPPPATDGAAAPGGGGDAPTERALSERRRSWTASRRASFSESRRSSLSSEVQGTGSNAWTSFWGGTRSEATNEKFHALTEKTTRAPRSSPVEILHSSTC